MLKRWLEVPNVDPLRPDDHPARFDKKVGGEGELELDHSGETG